MKHRHRVLGLVALLVVITQLDRISIPIQSHYGWRATFWSFGLLGPPWALGWYRWFRDSPRERPGVSEAELRETDGMSSHGGHAMPWPIALGTLFVGWLAFGYLVKMTGGYTWPMVPMAAFLFVGAALWLLIDPRRELAPARA